MTLYSIVLVIHLLSVVGLFIGLGLEWTATALLRRSAGAAEARAWLRVYRVSPPLSGPSLLIILLSGGYLASLIGVMKQGWIPATFIGIALAVILGVTVNMPRLGAIRKALPSGDEPLSAVVRARVRDAQLATSVRLRISIAAGIVFLMATKLPFGPSMFALACSIGFGLLLSIPAWRSSAAQ